MSLQPSSLATRCVHGPRRPAPGSEGLVLPIDRSSTFLQHEASRRAIDEGRWSEVPVYSRYKNPTVQAAEEHLADLEGAERALLFASGQAAMHATLLSLARPGRKIACARQLYGGTLDLLTVLRDLSIESILFDPFEEASLARALAEEPCAVLVESVSNPTLRVADLPRLAARVHAVGAALLVDATFASPVLQRPLELGADLVLHSATKFLGGHSDLLAGVVLGSAAALDPIWLWRMRAGGILDPAAAYLLVRGLMTLCLRVRAQGQGALALAQALTTCPAVSRVLHPCLPSHKDQTLAAQLLAGPVPIVSFELEGGDEALRPFVDRLRLAQDAPSLGGVETLVSLPRFMSHRSLSVEERAAVGIGPGFVRVAVGIEDPRDLVADFSQALGPTPLTRRA